MAQFNKVARTADIPDGECMTVECSGKKVALFHVGDVFYALDNTCLHRGGPLGEGTLDETIVTCPWHGWQYDVTTGQNVMNADVQVAKYECKVDGEDILVAV